MKNPRISRVVNFFAFNLLFFAVYLNFIHQDAHTVPDNNSTQRTYKQTTILADNPEQLNKATVNANPEQTMAENSNTSNRLLN